MTRPPAIEALQELDPGQRALLDLSLNRELSDSLIAGLLENTDESGVAGMRTEALAALARAAAIDGPGATREVERQLRSASDQQWLGAGETNGRGNGHSNGHAAATVHGRAAQNGHSTANGNGNGVVATVPARATQPSAPRRESTRSGRVWAVAFVVLALIGAASIAVALTSGDDEPAASSTAGEGDVAPAAAPANQGEPAAAPVSLEALTPGAVAGAATVAPAADGERYVLRLQGLPQPDGYYRLWAYDSLIESAPVAGLAAGSGSVTFELPADASDYENLDLSVEDGPGDSIHSGQSLFRISLADID